MNGPFFIAIASFLWGVGFFFRKIILADTNATILTTYIYLVMTFTLLASRKVRVEFLSSLKENFKWFMGVGIFGIAGIWFFLLGLDLNSLTISVIIMRLQPIFAIFFAMYFLDERMSLKKVPWIILSILSVYLLLIEPQKIATLFINTHPFSLNALKSLVSSNSDISLLGVLYLIFSAISWVISEIFSKKLSSKDIDPKVFTFIRFLIGAVIAIFPCLYLTLDKGMGVLYISSLNIVLMMLSVIISSFIGFTLYFKGIKSTEVIISSFVQLIAPISSIILGILFLGEKISQVQLFATIILFISVIYISKSDEEFAKKNIDFRN